MQEGIDACKDADGLWPCQMKLPVAEDIIPCGDWLAGEAGCKRLTFQLRVAQHLQVYNGADHNYASRSNCFTT